MYVKHVGVDSNLMRAMFPDRAGWTTTGMLLAELVDTAHWLQWAKTRDGQRNRNQPKRVPRPGVTTGARPGLKPKAAPLSVIKARIDIGESDDRVQRLKQLFDGR